MTRITEFVLSHKRLVVLAWVVLAASGLAAASSSTGALSQTADISGREGFDTNEQILQRYGNGGTQAPAPVVPVLSLPADAKLDSPAIRAQLARAMAKVARAVPGARVVSFASTGNRAFVSRDGRTTFAYVFPPVPRVHKGAKGPIDAVTAALADQRVGGGRFEVTGLEALRLAEGGDQGVGLLAEILVGALGALVVLAFVFGSFLAIVPLVMAGVAIPTIFLAIWPVAEVTSIYFVVEFLVGLIGLGVAIDYALVIVTRWREERVAGADNLAAVRVAMSTAGEAVVFSGLAVGIGLLALLVVPVPFLQSIGVGGLFIPLVSVLVAITLLPVLLATVGPRLDALGYRRALRRAQAGRESRWASWGRMVVRRRGWSAGIALGCVLALLIPALALEPGEPKAESLTTSAGSARAGYDTLAGAGIGAGALAPFELLTQGGPDAAARVRDAVADVSGVRGAVAPTGESWQRGETSLVEVIPVPDGSTPAAADALDRVRARLGQAELRDRVSVGGQTPQIADAVDAIYGAFPLLVAVLALVTFLVLARVFRSLLLAIKAVVFNVLSIGAVWGFIVLAWQNGWLGDPIFGVEATGAVTYWVPFLAFTFLYGLSMDYEVFILSRVREEYQRTGSTDGAVVAGLVSTGRLVMSASVILFLAFAALAATPETEVKILATSLAVGTVLDAALLRVLALPALVSLFGRRSWWLPERLARVLRTRPFPAPSEPSAPAGRPAPEAR